MDLKGISFGNYAVPARQKQDIQENELLGFKGKLNNIDYDTLKLSFKGSNKEADQELIDDISSRIKRAEWRKGVKPEIDFEKIKKSLEKGVDPNIKDRDGKTYLNLLAGINDPKSLEVMELLIKKGANVNESAIWACDPIERAVSHDFIEGVKLLINNGANVNNKYQFNETLLHHVQSKEIAKILIDQGLDINAKNEDDDTPLHEAIYSNNKELAKFLIGCRADCNIQDKLGYTPLHVAIAFNKNSEPDKVSDSKEVVRFLIDHGADTNITDEIGSTPYDTAISYGNVELAEIIKEKNKKGFFSRIFGWLF